MLNRDYLVILVAVAAVLAIVAWVAASAAESGGHRAILLAVAVFGLCAVSVAALLRPPLAKPD